MTKNIIFSFFSLLILISCKETNSESASEKFSIDYSNKKVLDSLIKSTSQSNDTLFLGFVMGMTKSDFKNHIGKMRSEGNIISFSTSNRYSTIAGTMELGEGYTFKTSISAENSGKTITGEGKYFLEPVYNKNGQLAQLNILSTEDWNGDYMVDEPDWLMEKIEKKYDLLTDESLKMALVENKFISDYNSVWKKGNLIIYETSLTVNYVDMKTLLVELLLKEIEKENIKEKNKDVKI